MKEIYYVVKFAIADNGSVIHIGPSAIDGHKLLSFETYPEALKWIEQSSPVYIYKIEKFLQPIK